MVSTKSYIIASLKDKRGLSISRRHLYAIFEVHIDSDAKKNARKYSVNKVKTNDLDAKTERINLVNDNLLC